MANHELLDYVKSFNYAIEIYKSDFKRRYMLDKFDFAEFLVLDSGIEDVADIDDLEDLFMFKVFANGGCSENKGYLSVMFVSTPLMLRFLNKDSRFFELDCTASVVDVNGNKRFRQSFAYAQEPQVFVEVENLSFGFEKYIKTDTLLSGKSELLPGDCLTIYMEINYRYGKLIDSIARFSNLCMACSKDGDKLYFSSDSVVGNELCQYSNVFRRMSEIPMIEKEKNRLYIVPEECHAIRRILNFLKGLTAEIPLAEYLHVLLEIYVVADKYNIELVLEDCKLRLESFLNPISDWECFEHATENIRSILELAETYGDKRLRESAEKFLKNREKIEARLRDKMEKEPDIIERKPTVCCYGRKVSTEQNPQLEHIVSGYGMKPQLGFYT